MRGLGLTAEQLERRRKYVAAGDAKRVLEGDWPALYREKMGIDEPEDLSGKLNVQLGSFTEPFILAWYVQQTGRSVFQYFTDTPMAAFAWREMTSLYAVTPELVVSKEYPWMAAHMDGYSMTSGGLNCVLDAKHVGQFRYEEIVERYTPAMTHQAIVANVDWWALAVLVGTNRFEIVEQEVDVFFRERLIEQEKEFWEYVVAGTEPPDMTPQPVPKAPPRLRNVDLAGEFGSEEWGAVCRRENWAVDCANEIAAFAETEGAFKAHAVAREQIKALVPDDVGSATRQTSRGLFRLKRSSNGALTMTLDRA